MQPLHESVKGKVEDLGSDGLVLALARAYTLSEIFPVHHPTVQEAIAEVSARSTEPIDLDVTSAGVQHRGRAVMDRHGYLREFGRDLKAVGATAVRLDPGLDADAIEFFLRALRRAQSASSSSFERELSEHDAPTVLVGFNGSPLPQIASSAPDAKLEPAFDQAAATAMDGAGDTGGAAGATEVDSGIALDPVDERLDQEIVFDDGAEAEQFLGEYEDESVVEPLDGPVDEAEWLHAMAYPEAEDVEAFDERPTLTIEAEAVDPIEEPLDAAEDAFAEPRLGLASLLPSDESEDAPPLPFIASPETPVGEETEEVADDPFLEAVSDPGEQVDEDWNESDTPMPWEDVGGFWGGEGTDWSSSSDDAFWDTDDAPPETVDSSADGAEPPVSEVVHLALEQEEWPLEDVMVDPDEAVLDGLDAAMDTDGSRAADNGTETGPNTPAEDDLQEIEGQAPQDAAPEDVEPEEVEAGMEAESPEASERSVSKPVIPPVIESELAESAGDLIKNEEDLAQVEAFRAALSDLSAPGQEVEGPPSVFQQSVAAPSPDVYAVRDGAYPSEDGVSDERHVVPVAMLAPETLDPSHIAPLNASLDQAPDTGEGEGAGAPEGEGAGDQDAFVGWQELPSAEIPDPSVSASREEPGASADMVVGEGMAAPSRTPADGADEFDLEAYDTFEALACACLRVGGPTANGIRDRVLERGRALLSQGEFETVADAVVAILTAPESDPTDVDAFAHRLADEKVVKALLQRLGDVKMPDEREEALGVAVRLSDLLAPAISRALSEVPPRPARRNYLDAMFAMGEAAFAEAIPMLEDSRWFIVRNGVDIIGETDGLGAIERLAAPLAHPDSRVRRATVMAMAKIGGDEAGSRLLTMFEDPDGDVREAAAMAVGHLRVERGVRPLLELLEKEKDDDLQMIVLRALGQIGDPAAVPAIEKRALGSFFSKPSTAVRIAAYRALSGMGTPHAGELIRQAATDKNPEVAAAAATLAAQI